MDIRELVEPSVVEPVPGKPLKHWMADIDIRIRRVEKLCWTLMGALPVLHLVRACNGA